MRTFAVFFGFFTSGGFLFGLVFLDATELVNKFLLTGKEGVAAGADIGFDAVFGATSLERSATGTGDGYRIVFGMDVGFHSL